ncbi:MAG TPA: hypothetical protein VKZ69_11175 [Limnochordales bacterium]|nr:hypothetical protein [Limnochordales bacterium]
MKRYIIRYHDGQEERERAFSSKVEAFRWFNRQCPAPSAALVEEEPDGTRTPPKALRRKGA